jgi:heterodisulfide reductase subunit A
LIGREIKIPAELVILSCPVLPSKDIVNLARMLKVPVDEYGFFVEKHPKLNPVEFATDGIYLCGSARYPCTMEESVVQAYAASAKALIPLKKGYVTIEAIGGKVNVDRCSGCGNCETVCPYNAVSVISQNGERNYAKINDVQCKGCGICTSFCFSGAMDQKVYSDEQILSAIRELSLWGKKENQTVILIFACNWCAYAGADLAGISRISLPTNIRVLRVMCSGRIKAEFIIFAIAWGIDGVLVLGCHPSECHYIEGNYHMRRRTYALSRLMKLYGFNDKRFRLDWVSASEAIRFKKIVDDFVKNIQKIKSR